ncbi:MAG: glycosyltransferase family A protein [Campylobacterota bacterium]|nr:glycosyltransferase family A protein [Campylobacterota bacterium]
MKLPIVISVIIPTYNRENLILRAINSVLNQTLKVDEIIVVDDGSKDDTRCIVKNLDIKYIYQENSGVSSARNRGIKEAKNDWICFLDSDDIWDKTKIEEQVLFHKNNKNILFSHTQEEWIFNGKIIKQKKHQQKPSGFCFEDNISHCLIGPSTVMIHKSIFNDIGIFDEGLLVCEDFDLWLRILSKYELGLIDKKLINKLAGHENQLSFITPMMDTYRIKALLKHKNKDIVKNMIIKKCDILIKGAIKHNNKDIENYYTKLKENNYEI